MTRPCACATSRPANRLADALRGHSDAVVCIALSPDATWVPSGSFDRTVRVCHADTGERLQKMEDNWSFEDVKRLRSVLGKERAAAVEHQEQCRVAFEGKSQFIC